MCYRRRDELPPPFFYAATSWRGPRRLKRRTRVCYRPERQAPQPVIQLMPTAPALHGVVETILYVDDVPRATAFYRDVLGCRPLTGDAHRFHALDAHGHGVLLLFKRGGTLTPQ